MGYGDTSAKDKKAAKNAQADASSKKAAEDASWEESDKNLSKKAARAAAKDDKADAKLEAKKEREALEAAEEAANSTLKGANKKAPEKKVTQAEIARRQALMAAAKATAKKGAKTETVAAPKIEENTNRQAADVDASGIDSALGQLGTGSEEKKKMTYKDYEAKVLPEIQAENPGLKMSQAKDKAFKMWERAPENPKNQDK